MDLSNIHQDHRALVQSILSDEYGVGYTDQQKEDILKIYEALADMPKKDWNKPETIEAVQQVVDENIK
jgi:hypothetical protein